jgi:hypothetical protein
MTTYYFEMEEIKRGWVRIESDSLENARKELSIDGFDAINIINCESLTDITIGDGGEEED